MKLGLKHYQQYEKFSCGPVALRMVFEHLGKNYSEKKMISLCKTLKKTGTSHKKMAYAVKKEGFVFRISNNNTIKDILMFLDAGYPVIVNYLDVIANQGHYAVVEGYNFKNKELILADPYFGQNYTIKWKEFNKMWCNNRKTSKRWMMVISKGEITI